MKQLTTALIQAVEMNAGLTKTPLQQELIDQLNIWGSGTFRVVVMGEIKKGKSSFINAMLGEEDLVPVSSDIATSTVYKIHYGECRRYEVHFSPESGKESLTISEDELATYGTEDGNPGNIRQVTFIDVCSPSPILKSGIIIMDTPGLGGLFKGHKQITYEYVPQADAVFFVTDSVESPIGVLELEYLNDILNITPNLYFVQTKCNAVDNDARQARRANNLSILSEALKKPAEKIPYFLLDSRAYFRAARKQDEEKLKLSGYPQFLNFISQTLQKNQQKLLANRVLMQTRPILEQNSELINSRLEVLQAQTEEEKQQLTEKLQEAQGDLKNWQEEEAPRIQSSMQSGLQRIRLRTLETYNRCRPNGEIQIEFERMIHDCKNTGELTNVLKEIEAKLPEYTAQVALATTEQIKQEVSSLLNSLIPRCDTGEITIAEEGSACAGFNTDALERLVNNMPSSNLSGTNAFDSLRTIVIGFTAGGSIATTIGGILGSVIPVVGTIAGSAVGGIIAGLWGGYCANALKKGQELKAAKQQACSAISQAMASVHTKLQSGIEQFLLEINSRTASAMREAIRQRRNELTKQMEDLRDSSKTDAKAIEEKKTALLKERAQFAAILKLVKARQANATEAA